MKVERLAIPEVILSRRPKFGDARGFFSETFHAGRFAAAGIDQPFVQDNQSLSARPGTSAACTARSPRMCRASSCGW